ncbi:hypothetical protein CSC74_09780 [Pseudoxanthomonas yeongjuensis]|uniref:DUF2339 domain-containing protein n=1 Tax=Pseudoxanthomonas yeongjuensis TaxID=377616 RepID=UPI0013910256|nr:DUF2339 domain-containing protein [Pseudoxanthomonas yeongjuensis]KAF1716511.1 hypothetical protein CSC74_09780 [Pseudoxanthomonas yeongjuensis]
MAGVLVLLGLVVLAVPILLIVALVSISGLKRRVGDLEGEVYRLRASEPAPAAARPAYQRAPAAAVADDMPSDEAMAREPTLAELTRKPSVQEPEATIRLAEVPDPTVASPLPVMPRAPAPPPLPPRPSVPPPPSTPDVFTVAARAIKRWFTVGNVPVKIGMLVLLAGVAALLKYASDQGWLTMPIELRLAGISAAALAGLVFGWRQREEKRSFALAVQGGAIGVLLLTVFAAFKMYHLIPAAAAFGISVVLIAGVCVLAVVQNSKTLAVLGILAGFMAPIWLSTDSGNHVALFSYYAVLNAAILAIAWFRPWRILNLLGFVFTFGIGTLWGVLQYRAEKFASTEPFLLLFFAFYLLIPILYARKQPASRGDFIDGCLVFGTPLVVFSLQAALLMPNDESPRMPLALCALGLGALYAVLAKLFIHRERYAALGTSYALLAVGFATLAVPLALSARATASVFALEGAALAWLGLRQQRWLPQLTGAGLQLAAAAALSIGVAQYWPNEQAIANPTFMGTLLIALAGFASAWAYRREERTPFALPYYLWGLLWWCGNGINEITRFVPSHSIADALLAFAAVTGWLAAEVHRKRPASALALTTLAGFVVALPLALAQMDAHQQPFADYGLWAWLAFAVLGIRSLLCLRASEDRFAGWAQFAWWLVWPAVASLLFSWLADRFDLAQGWQVALLSLPWLAAIMLSIFRWSWLAAPQGERFDPYRTALQTTYFTVLGLWWLVALSLPGDSAPLPWIPLLNPMELAQLALLALAARWLWSEQAPAWLQRLRIFKMSAAGFLMVTFVTLRAVHHWGGVEWNPDMLSTSLAQTSLTVVWSVLGVLGWVIGSRRGQRGLWLAGAVLMGVVLAKLVFVDRQHLGNLLGIGSFIAYGLLCTLVGYFAPAPPRAATEEVST